MAFSDTLRSRSPTPRRRLLAAAIQFGDEQLRIPQDQQPANDILKFAHISRPVIGQEGALEFRGNRRKPHSRPTMALEEELRQG